MLLVVDGLSKIDKLVFRSYEEETAENFIKMLLATAADVRVILIKLADSYRRFVEDKT